MMAQSRWGLPFALFDCEVNVDHIQAGAGSIMMQLSNAVRSTYGKAIKG